MFAAVSTGQFEHILSPLCDRAVSLLDILDEFVRISSAPLEDGGGHRVEGRELAKDIAGWGSRFVRLRHLIWCLIGWGLTR